MINLYIANITLLKCTRVLFYHLGDDRSMLNCFKTTKLGEGGPTKGFFFRIFFLKFIFSSSWIVFEKDNLFDIDILYTWYICLCHGVKWWWFHWVNFECFVICWPYGCCFTEVKKYIISKKKRTGNPILFNLRGKT